MTLLRHRAAGLAALAHDGSLGLRIAEQMRHRTGRGPSPSEQRSWDRSLPVLAQDLIQAGLDDVEMLVEHHLPLTSKRVDVILAGAHPRTGLASYVVVELKQWSHATTYEDDANLVVVDGAPRRPMLHPVLQVRGYCDYLVGFTRSLHARADAVVGVAYLHNATELAVADLRDQPQDARGRLFTGERRGDFVSYLREQLDPRVSGVPFGDELLNSAVAPSTQLLQVAAAEIRDREQFVLLDRQRLAYEDVLHAVERARRNDGKTVFVITGGPAVGRVSSPSRCWVSSRGAGELSCTPRGRVRSRRRCARSQARGRVRPRACSSTSISSSPRSRTDSTC